MQSQWSEGLIERLLGAFAPEGAEAGAGESPMGAGQKTRGR